MSAVRISVFEDAAQEYDSWFERHPEWFQNECRALEMLVPRGGIGVEIGTGTGRFAKQFKVQVGVEPVQSMARLAVERGITVVRAEAEELPFHGQTFDFALMVTAVCFLRDVTRAFSEVYRILKQDGSFIIGFIDRESSLGRKYEAQKSTNPWYRDAHFHSVSEITSLLRQAGFNHFDYWQTLLSMDKKTEEPQPGYGSGGFVVVKAVKNLEADRA